MLSKIKSFFSGNPWVGFGGTVLTVVVLIAAVLVVELLSNQVKESFTANSEVEKNYMTNIYVAENYTSDTHVERDYIEKVDVADNYILRDSVQNDSILIARVGKQDSLLMTNSLIIEDLQKKNYRLMADGDSTLVATISELEIALANANVVTLDPENLKMVEVDNASKIPTTGSYCVYDTDADKYYFLENGTWATDAKTRDAGLAKCNAGFTASGMISHGNLIPFPAKTAPKSLLYVKLKS